MAYGLRSRGVEFDLLFTATGNELPPVREHIDKVVEDLEVDLIDLEAPTLESLILKYEALPNHRQRWCTREIKVEPCARWLREHPGSTLFVGLRADEEHRRGLYGDFAEYSYPLREWGWGIDDVVSYLEELEICVPQRTDCAVCPFQRLGEWRDLWQDWPEWYKEGVMWEDLTGHTFRSPTRDTWPADLRSLAEEFARGRPIRQFKAAPQCRICRF